MGQVKAMLLDRLNDPDYLVQLELDDLMGYNTDPVLPAPHDELDHIPKVGYAISSNDEPPF